MTKLERQAMAALKALRDVGALTEDIGGGDEVKAAQKQACDVLNALEDRSHD